LIIGLESWGKFWLLACNIYLSSKNLLLDLGGAQTSHLEVPGLNPYNSKTKYVLLRYVSLDHDKPFQNTNLLTWTLNVGDVIVPSIRCALSLEGVPVWVALVVHLVCMKEIN